MGFAEKMDVRIRQFLGAPLVGILGEELQRLAIILERRLQSMMIAARNGHVGAEPRHYLSRFPSTASS